MELAIEDAEEAESPKLGEGAQDLRSRGLCSSSEVRRVWRYSLGKSRGMSETGAKVVSALLTIVLIWGFNEQDLALSEDVIGIFTTYLSF
jgi:hypothetical protein